MAKGEASVRDRVMRGPGSGHCHPHRPWTAPEGQAGVQAGSLAAHKSMAGVVFSLKGAGGNNFSPSSFFSKSSSSCNRQG